MEAYWHTGKIILQRQEEAAWGAKVIDRLSADLREEFPDMGRLSSRNLLSMSLFAEAFPDGPIAKQAVSQLPRATSSGSSRWSKPRCAGLLHPRGHHPRLEPRSILEMQIQGQLHLRAGKAVTNFALTMPPAESDMAAQLFKEPLPLRLHRHRRSPPRG